MNIEIMNFEIVNQLQGHIMKQLKFLFLQKKLHRVNNQIKSGVLDQMNID